MINGWWGREFFKLTKNALGYFSSSVEQQGLDRVVCSPSIKAATAAKLATLSNGTQIGSNSDWNGWRYHDGGGWFGGGNGSHVIMMRGMVRSRRKYWEGYCKGDVRSLGITETSGRMEMAFTKMEGCLVLRHVSVKCTQSIQDFRLLLGFHQH